jgi:hypothetical protein
LRREHIKLDFRSADFSPRSLELAVRSPFKERVVESSLEERVCGRSSRASLSDLVAATRDLALELKNARLELVPRSGGKIFTEHDFGGFFSGQQLVRINGHRLAFSLAGKAIVGRERASMQVRPEP